jgi:hypothetical protein
MPLLLRCENRSPFYAKNLRISKKERKNSCLLSLQAWKRATPAISRNVPGRIGTGDPAPRIEPRGRR